MADAKGESIRTVIKFPPQTAARLMRLKEYLEAISYIDVIRTALAHLEVCVEIFKNGGKLIQVDKDGKHRDLYIPRP